MRALRLDDEPIVTYDEPEPAPNPDEALIALRLAGICQTDQELARGYAGFRGIMGHEFGGELLTDAGPWQAGQRVVGEINITCGQCDFCLAGIPGHCRQRAVLGIHSYPGAFADRLRLPVRNLHAVPDAIPDEVAVFTEPFAAALQVLEMAAIHPAHRVFLIGAGKLGLLAAQVLRRTGCDLAIIARQSRPIELLRRWGISWLDAREEGWLKAVYRRSAHVVIDCTGNAEGFATALELVRPRGTIVLKSTYAGLPQIDLSRVAVDEVSVVGSRCGPFEAALRIIPEVDVQSMIERIYPLDEALTAFEHATHRGVLKVLLRP
jgi:threonine dehydrogenase-like Zn-dependent dehydrogenase